MPWATSLLIVALAAAVILALLCLYLLVRLRKLRAAAAGGDGGAEGRYRAMFEAACEGIVLHENGAIIDANPAFEALSGYTRDELRRLRLDDMIVPELRQEARRRLAARIDGIYETRGVAKDGSVVDLEIHARNHTLNGRPVRVAALRDVRAHRRAEEALRRSEAQFRSLFEGLPIGLYRTTPDGRVLMANPTLVKMLGYDSFDELARRNLEADGAAAFEPDYPRRRFKELIEATGEIRDYVSHWRRHDGSTIVVRESARAVQGADGQLVYEGSVEDITDQRRAQEALRQTEERYRAIVEAQTEMVYRTRPDWTITYVNPAFRRYFGMAPEQLIGSKFMPEMPPEDRRRSDEYANSFGPHKTTGSIEHRVIMPGGEVRWQQWTDRAILDEAGRVLEFQSVGRDITEQKRAEEALRQSEERLRSVIETAKDAIVTTDDAGIITSWNRAAQAMFGYPAAEAIGSHATMIVSERRREGYCSRMAAALRAPTAHGAAGMEVTAGRRDGSEFPADISLSTFTTGQGLFVTCIVRDTSERVQAEEALRHSEERYRLLFNSGTDAIFVHRLTSQNGPGTIIEVNDVACGLLGYSRDELLGRSIQDVAAANQRPDDARTVQKLRAEKHILFEASFTTKDGGTIPVEINSHLFDLGGEAAVLASARDISERKRLEEHLRQSQKMETVGRLAGGIAHDFNNLMTAITGHASFALDDLRPDTPAYEDLRQVIKAADRAATLTQQLLAFSRRQVIQTQPVNLNDLILDMDRMLRRLIREDIELVTIPAPDLGPVKVDPGQMQQVIANLVINARDALVGGGTLTIETGNATLDSGEAAENLGVPPGDYVMLRVSDTGVGMSDEVLEHIFEPFFTTKPVGEGTGLGLATVYGIVKQHQGGISVQSEPGRGSAFVVYLPAAGADQVRRPAVAGELSRLPRGSETVLLVEDEPSVRGVAMRILERQGYEVIEATNGEHALRLVRQHEGRINLLLTDLVMPQLSGRELVDILREEQPQLKVLFISGYTEDTVLRQGNSDGSVGYLQKPFTAALLAHKVRQVLDRG